jgi:cupin fold WbuC family metalloprotein
VIDLLKRNAAASPRRRCRLCFHPGPEAAQQEMLIVMHRSSYVRPHRHFGKLETLGIIEGQADTLLFDGTGALTARIPMSPAAEGGAFFYRMPEGLFHTLHFLSEWLVFVETTIGPFDPARSQAANWAPPESEAAAGHAYLTNLRSGAA